MMAGQALAAIAIADAQRRSARRHRPRCGAGCRWRHSSFIHGTGLEGALRYALLL